MALVFFFVLISTMTNILEFIQGASQAGHFFTFI